MISDSRKEALRRLLDDESPAVRDALLREFRESESEGVGFLRDLVRDGDWATRKHARSLLAELGADDPDGDFRAFIRSFRYELEAGCFLLERTVHPEVEWGDVSRFLDGLAARCAEFIVSGSSVFEQCKQINLVLFHEARFRGDLKTFENPENNFIRSVISRRKGIPISLSVIYLLVADRCGISLEPIGTPGRFLLASLEDDHAFYIDPFERGCFRSEEEVRQMLLSRHLEHDGAEYLLPCPVGEVLCRFCRNLVHQYTVSGDLHKARQFAGYIQEFEDAYERESA